MGVTGVETLDFGGGGSGMPYSRSFAGVGGRFDGVSEWRECWEGVEVITMWAEFGLLGSGDGRT